ncbi:hypothetical protein [Hyalangium sp.]|uniref:hypothetical protein n=1 Tax=Hyalangium sp. TaxID=2028555 RepID=UPI002D48EC88|nr:hypothetical protein [Hyalangium sp.]HYH99650.1 hypothetical protein [Hyalangium sp.]
MPDQVFETILSDSNGSYPYRLAVNEKDRTGEMIIPGDKSYKLKTLRRLAQWKIDAWLMLNSITLKCVVELVDQGGGFICVMSLAGSPRRYATPDAKAFADFLAALKLPKRGEQVEDNEESLSLLMGANADEDARDYVVLESRVVPNLCAFGSGYVFCKNRHAKRCIRVTIKTRWIYEGQQHSSYEDLFVRGRAEEGVGCVIPGPTGQRFDREIHSAVFVNC